MYAIEFVVDKVAYLDSTWDVIQAAIRTAVGGAIGVLFAGEAACRRSTRRCRPPGAAARR